jgi:hypothetical protein
MGKEKIILSVPFCDKDQVKKLGAMWDSSVKSWFIYSHFDLNKFQKWIPYYTLRSDSFAIIKGLEHCWRCDLRSVVYAFYLDSAQEIFTDDDGDEYWEATPNGIVVISIIHLLDGPNREISVVSNGKVRLDGSYIANHCEHCSAKLGDHYMFGEPGGAFFPSEYGPVAKVVNRYSEKFSADAAYSFSASSVI